MDLKETQSELTTIAARLATAYPDTNRAWQARVVSLRELRGRGTEPGMLFSLAGSMVLLLIACANIGAIQLVRIAQRRHEIVLRFALGSSRMRVASMVVIEALLLSLSGAIIGLLVMVWGVRFLIHSGLLQFGLHDVPLDLRVIGFAIATSVGASLLFSLVPLQQALSLLPGNIVAEWGRGASSSIRVRRLHSWLVAGRLSLALVLLVAALLLNASFRNVEHVDLGFDPQGVLTGRVAYFNDQKRIQFFHSIVDRLRGLPGVQDIATSYSLPLRGRCIFPTRSDSSEEPD